MIIHFLPGDAAAAAFADSNIGGTVAVCRECLVEGPLNAPDPKTFRQMRQRYLDVEHPNAGIDYESDVAGEFDKLLALSSGDEIDLWFENELFCQVNLWFTLDLLLGSDAAIYRVFPNVKDPAEKWKSFTSDTDLSRCLADRVELTPADRKLGSDLWLAFQSGDREKLAYFGQASTEAFPFLGEVCEAAAVIDSLPKSTLRSILDSGVSEFSAVFAEFSRRLPVFGFGDSQVEKILGSLNPGPA